jgi:hypothetical protein
MTIIKATFIKNVMLNLFQLESGITKKSAIIFIDYPEKEVCLWKIKRFLIGFLRTLI